MQTPSTRQLVALVALVAIVAAGLVAVLWLTPASGRSNLLGQFAGYLPGVGAAVGVLFTWLGLRNLATDHGAKLDTITHQTNGVLTERIRTAVTDALHDLLGAGVTVPTQRTPDTTAPAIELPPADPPAVNTLPEGSVVGAGAIG